MTATNPQHRKGRVGAWIGLVLLTLMVCLILLTLVELAERGAPWSQHGYPTTTTHAGAAPPRDRPLAPGPLR